MENITLLNHFINSAVPYAWDDSESWFEFLGKVLAKVNELVTASNQFFSLDLQQYVDTVLNAWKTDGTLETILGDSFAEYAKLTDLTDAVDTLNTDLTDAVDTLNTDLTDAVDTLNTNLANRTIDYVYVTDYGALGDGVHDDTAAFQAAIETHKKVLIPNGTYLITDSLIVHPGTDIFGSVNIAPKYSDSIIKLQFDPPSLRSMFITTDVPAPDDYGYMFAIRIGGFAVSGTNSNVGKYLFELGEIYKLHIDHVKQYGGFVRAMKFTQLIDSLIEYCSFQGCVEQILEIARPVDKSVSTTTLFNKCYFSQSLLGYSLENDSINSLSFNECVFESLEKIGKISGNCNVFHNNIYVENCPRVGVTGNLFDVGDALVPETANGRHHAFIINGGFLEAKMWSTGTVLVKAVNHSLISISNLVIQHVHTLFNVGENVYSVSVKNCTNHYGTYVCSETDYINKVKIDNCYFPFTVMSASRALQYIKNIKVDEGRILSGTPVGNLIPVYIGEEVFDYTNMKWYKSTGYTNTNWVALN